jgi:hypothetical protein
LKAKAEAAAGNVPAVGRARGKVAWSDDKERREKVRFAAVCIHV